ncbi:hypothetical protein SARC_05637 [Sphaeroforma arctica JP610]|uniref:U6 snRNA phosphodiesterase 1 n=1 Tax=Sphaeroforma arctica JP610 TaxID=667725 RepID=A0A0L0FZ32_9EUKA|nr:hypothetical protein SARC_05637 [Sphaeroforma arctica JP610]KNC82065.1 hypothetical protein SARC_05637 [Sphaeroforma arctica JP610]|eukprot:XP_014155967.1 hypothetical protein SARC_05637 [Sphaeroforma arctica JP610]
METNPISHTSLQQPVHSFVSEENRVLHVSLSKTVALQHHEIDAFYAALAEKLRSVHAFTLSLQGLRHFTNENEHRSFLALCVADECHDYIRQHVLPCVDTVMRLFIKDVYYQNPSFHASVCWWASASPSPSTFKGDTGEHPERDMGAVAADARMAQRGGAVGRQTGVTQDTGRPTQASSVADTLSTERGTSMLTGMCGHTPVARDVPAAAGLEGVSGRDDVVKALADVDVSTGHVAQIALENFVIDTIYCKFGHTVREIKLSQ